MNKEPRSRTADADPQPFPKLDDTLDQRDQRITFQPADLIWPAERPVPLVQASEAAGLSPEFAGRVLGLLSVPNPEAGIRESDLEILRAVRAIINADVPEAAIVEAARVLGDALERLSQAEVSIFHRNVHEPLLRSRDNEEAARLAAERTAQVLPAVRGIVATLHDRLLERAAFDDSFLHAKQNDVFVVAFFDLAGFVALTEKHGDEEAARIAEDFQDLARQAVRERGGRVLKTIGDGVMVVLRDAGAAVEAAVSLAEEAAGSGLPPVRGGIHLGPAVERAGDLYGSTVNVASRITSVAPRGAMLATSTVRRSAAGRAVFAPYGKRRLTGLDVEMALYKVRAHGDTARRRFG